MRKARETEAGDGGGGTLVTLTRLVSLDIIERVFLGHDCK